MNHPLVLVILDGWGYREETQYNAIAQAHTPQWDAWWEEEEHILLEASGLPVGLPDQQMGNSEVGHMHIGAGRIIPQDYTRINEALRNGEFAHNPVFLETIETLKQSGKALHIMGLLSPGGVHSHEEHLFALLSLCAEHHFNKVYLHLFLDGRDTPPQSALTSFARLATQLEKNPIATICSISGRYYAMDRDKRWQRIEPVYRLLTELTTEHHFQNAEAAIHAFYQQNISDEFIPPTQIGEGKIIKDGDALLFFNFRADRARQLSKAFICENFDAFPRPRRPKLSRFISMTQYAKDLPTIIAFPPLTLQNTLGSLIADNGLRQLRIAETEKYAHVTFFLNGGSEQVFANETRTLIQSPLVKTYDLQPEMSSQELTKTVVDAIESAAYDVIICNYANADMVGHTGNFNATVKAIEAIDRSLAAIGNALKKKKGYLLITSDHGNAEAMFDDNTKQAHTAHTNNVVPLLFIGEGWHFNVKHGTLIDIAPTLLTLLGIPLPSEMTGQVLLSKNQVHQTC